MSSGQGESIRPYTIFGLLRVIYISLLKSKYVNNTPILDKFSSIVRVATRGDKRLDRVEDMVRSQLSIRMRVLKHE